MASLDDKPEVVIAYFQANGPWIGTSYPGDSTAKCKSITPDRVPNGAYYNVKVDYEPKDQESEEKPDENGENQEDPLLWRDDIDISYTQISIPAETATFYGSNMGGVNGTAMRGRAVNSDGPVINSALVPYDPPYEYEVDIKVYRFTKNVATWDDAENDEYQGGVNDAEVIVTKAAYGFTATWGPLTARIKNISGSFQMANKIGYWKKTTEVHVNPIGWRKSIVDRGLERRQLEGDPGDDLLADGNPVTISPSDIKPGRPHHARIKDKDGYPITSPVLLDGDGQPLKPDLAAVYLEYGNYAEISFAGITW